MSNEGKISEGCINVKDDKIKVNWVRGILKLILETGSNSILFGILIEMAKALFYVLFMPKIIFDVIKDKSIMMMILIKDVVSYSINVFLVFLGIDILVLLLVLILKCVEKVLKKRNFYKKDTI